MTGFNGPHTKKFGKHCIGAQHLANDAQIWQMVQSLGYNSLFNYLVAVGGETFFCQSDLCQLINLLGKHSLVKYTLCV